MIVAGSRILVGAMSCIGAVLLAACAEAATKRTTVSAGTWCTTGVAMLPKDALDTNHKLRKAVQIRAVKSEDAWLTSCPVDLISAKPNDAVCDAPTVLYDGKNDIQGHPGFQMNSMVVLRDQGSKKYTLVIDDPTGVEIARSNDVDLSPLGASGRWAHAEIDGNHDLYIYFLDFYDDSKRQMTKVYYVEDFDSRDSDCNDNLPSKPGNVVDCRTSGDCSNLMKSEPRKTFGFSLLELIELLKNTIILKPMEEGVGVGTEKHP